VGGGGVGGGGGGRGGGGRWALGWCGGGRPPGGGGGGVRICAPVQTSPGAHLPYCRMSTKSFPGVKRPWRGFDYPPTSNDEAKEKVELWPVIGKTFHLP